MTAPDPQERMLTAARAHFDDARSAENPTDIHAGVELARLVLEHPVLVTRQPFVVLVNGTDSTDAVFRIDEETGRWKEMIRVLERGYGLGPRQGAVYLQQAITRGRTALGGEA